MSTNLQLYPHALFTAEAVEPVWFSDAERHEIAMREVSEQVYFTSDSGQRFSGLHLNRDYAGISTPIVQLGSFMGASKTPDNRYRAYQYAVAEPERQFVILDMPSHGSSDPMTDAQRQETFRSKKLSKIGQAQAEGVRRFMPEAGSLIVTGDSLGAQIATDFTQHAPSLDLQPELLVGFDMAGTENRLSVSLSASYFIGETIIGKQYHRGPDNMKLESHLQRFRDELNARGVTDTAFDPLATFKSDPLIGLFTIMRSPLANDAGLEVLDQALSENESLIAAMVSGGLSKVCRWQKIADKVQDLNVRYGERFSWDLWPNDSHTMGIGSQQPRMALFVSEVIHDTGII